MAAANLWVTPRRLRSADFSVRVEDDGREFLVTAPASPQVRDVRDINNLSGIEEVVREVSSYFSSLKELDKRCRAQGRIRRGAQKALE